MINNIAGVTTSELADEILEEFYSNPGIRAVHGKRAAAAAKTGKQKKPGKLSALADLPFMQHALNNVENSIYGPTNPPANIKIHDVLNDDVYENPQHVKASEKINPLLQTLMGVHDSMSRVVRKVNNEGSSAEALESIQNLNNEYIRLCKEMLSEVAKIQRSKLQHQRVANETLRQEVLQYREDLNNIQIKYDREVRAKAKIEEDLSHMSIKATTLEKNIDFLYEQARQHDITMKLTEKTIEDLKSHKVTMEAQMRETIARMKEEQRFIIEARVQEIRQQINKANQLLKDQNKKNAPMSPTPAHGNPQSHAHNSNSNSHQNTASNSNTATSATSSGPSLSELVEASKKTLKRPSASSSTQTEVDEYGLWDKKDGWCLPVSGTIIARNRWRRAANFAKCPCCKGSAIFVGQVAMLLKQLQRGDSVLNTDKLDEKRGHHWKIPDDLVRFAHNLPRSCQAMPLKPLSWCVGRVHTILRTKYTVDVEDDALGYPFQSLPEFLIELSLLKSESRGLAEVLIYRLVSSLEEHYRKHPMLHTFVRLLGCLDDLDENEALAAEAKKKQAKERRMKKEQEAIKSLKARDRVKLLSETEEETSVKPSKSSQKDEIKISDCILPLNMLTVYVFVRECMMADYDGVYKDGILEAKQNSDRLSSAQRKLETTHDENGSSDSFGTAKIPKHVVVGDHSSLWIPLDRAVKITQTALSFLDESMLNACFRGIEYDAKFLLEQGQLEIPEGMHTVVRSMTRTFMQISRDRGADLTWDYIDEHMKSKTGGIDRSSKNQTREFNLNESRNYIVMVDMDKCLQIVVEALLVRSKFVEKKLESIFVEGDSNGDGVLNFIEFTAIVKKVAPHFHQRRVLKMFREALSLGSDSDSIGPPAFVSVCKNHGLIQLVDIRRLKEVELAALFGDIIAPGSLPKLNSSQPMSEDLLPKFSGSRRDGFRLLQKAGDLLGKASSMKKAMSTSSIRMEFGEKDKNQTPKTLSSSVSTAAIANEAFPLDEISIKESIEEHHSTIKNIDIPVQLSQIKGSGESVGKSQLLNNAIQQISQQSSNFGKQNEDEDRARKSLVPEVLTSPTVHESPQKDFDDDMDEEEHLEYSPKVNMKCVVVTKKELLDQALKKEELEAERKAARLKQKQAAKAIESKYKMSEANNENDEDEEILSEEEQEATQNASFLNAFESKKKSVTRQVKSEINRMQRIDSGFQQSSGVLLGSQSEKAPIPMIQVNVPKQVNKELSKTISSQIQEQLKLRRMQREEFGQTA